jgi:UDP-N-acetylmuramoyl-tripeptide--D-alanyl-D-alanine ligase
LVRIKSELMSTTLPQLYEIFLHHPEISTDSRKITPGCIFFGLKGDRFDGSQYAAQALESGAAVAVTDTPPPEDDSRYFVVEDVLETLQQLALHHRKQFRLPVIAITGTNGKTTTKELIAAVLSKKFNCLATQGNLNNHIGVPLTLLRIRKETEMAVIEMGANHAGEIARLCGIARPDFGIITNIGKAHLEGFGSFDGVIAAKSELYRYIASEGQMLFVNRDDELLSSLSDGCPRINYSRVNRSCYQGELVSADPYVVLDIIGTTGNTRIRSRLFGEYNFENILAAACIGNFFGVPVTSVRDAVEGFIPANNRSQVLQGKRNLLIMDAYNANPSSMAAALSNFARSASTGKMIILGDMLELGTESEKEHLGIIRLAEELGLTDAIYVGPVFSSLLQNSCVAAFDSVEKARTYLSEQPFSGRTILIKGSRGIRLEIVEEIL